MVDGPSLSGFSRALLVIDDPCARVIAPHQMGYTCREPAHLASTIIDGAVLILQPVSGSMPCLVRMSFGQRQAGDVGSGPNWCDQRPVAAYILAVKSQSFSVGNNGAFAPDLETSTRGG